MPTAQDPRPPAGAAPLHAEKQRMRQQVLALRNALDADARAASDAAIAARILALPSFQAAQSVLLTLPFRGEWDTLPLFEAALGAGKQVVLPRVDSASRMLSLHAIRDVVRDVAPGYGGISEPHARLPQFAADNVDWVLVPGIAFDLHGRRLGYGGGFYDRLLPLLPRYARHVAGAYDEQIVDAVPFAPHDVAVHQVVTPTRILAF